MQQKVGGDQMLRFGISSGHCVLDHVAVDDGTQLVDVIGTDRRNQQKRHQHRLLRMPHCKQRHDQNHQGTDRRREDNAQKHPPFEDPKQMAPECAVAQCQKIGRNDQVQIERGHGRAPVRPGGPGFGRHV